MADEMMNFHPAQEAKNTKSRKPWVERYRPSTLNEVAGQQETVAILEKTIHSKNLPHLLFYGGPGTGKTSTILALAKDIYGPDLFKARVLELNASDERGIDVIRTKVKDFAQLSIGGKGKGPPYKLIILDEADSMTTDAQAALRRTMETYSHITRFCLICNYLSRIIEPLASRCAKFRFHPLPEDLMIARLEEITVMEEMSVTHSTFQALVKVSQGDLRQAITLLQTAKDLCISSGVTPHDIYEMTGTIPDSFMDTLVESCLSNNMDKIHAALRLVFRQGYSGLQLLSQLQEEVVSGFRFDKVQKAKVAVLLGRTEKRLADGAEEELQIFRLLSCLVV